MTTPTGTATTWPPGAAGERLQHALAQVLDPDLGINIVDFGFVRSVSVEDGVALLTMTLTSAACPLTKVIEDQIRLNLVDAGIVSDFRIHWSWVPSWTPADITPDGKEQLRAVGFSFG